MTGRTGIQWKSASDGKDLAGTQGLVGGRRATAKGGGGWDGVSAEEEETGVDEEVLTRIVWLER